MKRHIKPESQTMDIASRQRRKVQWDVNSKKLFVVL